MNYYHDNPDDNIFKLRYRPTLIRIWILNLVLLYYTHFFATYMILELDHVIRRYFSGRFVAKNSNMTTEWRERVRV